MNREMVNGTGERKRGDQRTFSMFGNRLLAVLSNNQSDISYFVTILILDKEYDVRWWQSSPVWRCLRHDDDGDAGKTAATEVPLVVDAMQLESCSWLHQGKLSPTDSSCFFSFHEINTVTPVRRFTSHSFDNRMRHSLREQRHHTAAPFTTLFTSFPTDAACQIV